MFAESLKEILQAWRIASRLPLSCPTFLYALLFIDLLCKLLKLIYHISSTLLIKKATPGAQA
jgi:hypothetical protein